MKEIKTGKAHVLLIPIPQHAYNVKITRSKKYFHIGYDLSTWESEGLAIIYKDLGGKKNYPDKITLLFTTENVTEEQAAMVVGSRIIHRIVAGAGVGGEHCGVSGCANKSHGLYFAMLYEGEYFDNEIISAGTPVCADHARDSKEEFQHMLSAHLLTAPRYAVLNITRSVAPPAL